MRIRILTAALVLSAGVAHGNPPEAPEPMEFPPFPEQEHLAYQGDGAGEVTGQAFLRQRGGGVVTCAGEHVMLLPKTPYMTTALYPRQMTLMLPADNPAHRLVRSTQCDAMGNFRFTKLPAGEYHIVTAVRWVVADQPQGGALHDEITVTDGPLQVMLTDSQRVTR